MLQNTMASAKYSKGKQTRAASHRHMPADASVWELKLTARAVAHLRRYQRIKRSTYSNYRIPLAPHCRKSALRMLQSDPQPELGEPNLPHPDLHLGRAAMATLTSNEKIFLKMLAESLDGGLTATAASELLDGLEMVLPQSELFTRCCAVDSRG